jgi:starch synthase (maltosyl-transferring)
MIEHGGCPKIMALFQKRIDGDDALLRLASLRFREAHLGAEYYAESPDELEWLLGFRPFHDAPVAVHLPRGIDLFAEGGQGMIAEFSRRFKERIYGLVIHDQQLIASRFDDYLTTLRDIASRIEQTEGAPRLFIEYAAGIAPDIFTRLFRALGDLDSVSACVDIGHLGIHEAATAFSKTNPGTDICSLRPESPELPSVIENVERAVDSGREKVLQVVAELCILGKPLHFHLHDAHPLSPFSPLGVADHLSFFTEISLPFEYRGKRSLAPMFGREGLSRIVDETLRTIGADMASFSLEIHPTEGKLALGNASYLFSHWVDKGNAERMNYWLSVLARNQRLLLKSCPAAAEVSPTKKMIIYNLFPLLAGKFTTWERHLQRACDMGFNWIFVNPIQRPGSSGSLYSIADYFDFHPLLIDRDSEQTPKEQVTEMIRRAERMGLKVMVDLVINHCSVNSDLLKFHPEWFLWESKGRVAHPFADENGKKVIWKDLAKFDHRNTRDKEGLYRFFLGVTRYLAELGFKGFRCDAAYQVPRSLWERLIKETKGVYPDVLFFAETLGNPPDLTRKTASAGFDFIFNSSKWWDFNSEWLMKQYALTRDIAPSISFPESHDTVRLCEELNGNIEGMKQRYLFSSLFSGGVMMPIGFEFGFRKRLHVVKTKPEDWEDTGIDLTYFITQANSIKSEHRIFQEDAPAEILHHDNPNVLLMWKASTHTQEESLLILNKDITHSQRFETDSLRRYLQSGAPLVDISPEDPLDYLPAPFSYDLAPGQGIVLITEREVPAED